MKKQLWNTGWGVAPGVPSPFGMIFGSEPKPVPVMLPQDAMILEERRPDAPSGNQTGYYPVNSYTYTKTFFAPREWARRQITLEFEGVMAKAAVYLNGELVAKNSYGYAQFFADLNPFLRYGEENTLQALAISHENGSRWYPGAGIYRDVWLYEGDLTHVEPEGVRLTTERVEDCAVIRTEIRIKNSAPEARKLRVCARLVKDGQTAAACESVVSMLSGEGTAVQMRLYADEPKLWSPEHPELYTWQVDLLEGDALLDSAEGSFGIRTLTLDARRGLRINGVETKLRGACIHHDNGVIGATTLPDAEEFRLGKLKEAGFNAIRSAHHPAGKALLDTCDRLGILVMDEATDIWEAPKNSADYFFDFVDEWPKTLERMAAKDYNHPSVILYSLGNEIGEIGRRNGGRRSREMANHLHALDPTRFVTGAISGFLAMSDRIGEMVDTMEQAEKEIKQKASQGSEALNAAMSKMSQARLDAFSTSDGLSETMEEAACAWDVAGYNYLTARHEFEHIRHPERPVVGSETYPPEIARLWDIVTRNAHVIGDFTWTGYDYLGEAGIASYHYTPDRNEQGWYPDRLAYSGDININGFRRPVSYLREIAYGLRKEPYIAVERVDRFGQPDNTNDWKYYDVIASWTLPGWEGKPTAVHVLSSSDEVELLQNGVSLGRKPAGKASGYDVAFPVSYTPGELVAIGYTGGVEDGRFVLQTAGAPEKLSVTASRDTICADGRGLCLLTVDLLDSVGIPSCWETRNVTVQVEGAAVLAGLGSADPSCAGSYQQAAWPTYDGRVLAAVRSNGEAGDITVSLSCEGCPDVSIRLKAE